MKYNDAEHKKLMDERRAAGKLIDPATAVITWHWAQVLDPYGDGLEIPEEGDCVGRFRAPDSDIWVEFPDLPDATREEIEKLGNAGYYDGQSSEVIKALTEANSCLARAIGRLISKMEPSARPAAIRKFADLITAVASLMTTALDQQPTATKD